MIDCWVETVDGIRTDVCWGVPKGFWQEMDGRIERHDPEFLLHPVAVGIGRRSICDRGQ